MPLTSFFLRQPRYGVAPPSHTPATTAASTATIRVRRSQRGAKRRPSTQSSNAGRMYLFIMGLIYHRLTGLVKD